MTRHHTTGPEPARIPLEHCVCGSCTYCPDGWHGDAEGCSCTPDCLLGEDPCPACGLHSVTDGTCRACDWITPDPPP